MRAIIVGHSGQDGRLLFQHLQSCGYEVLGFSRSSVHQTDSDFVAPATIDLDNEDQIYKLIDSFHPTEVYYLPAWHDSAEQACELDIKKSFSQSHKTHVLGLLNVLCAIKDLCQHCKLFYASSSLIFSGCADEVQSESTPLSPKGIYAITKAEGMLLCREFREHFGIFASVGILYNHESCFRHRSFLSQKIIHTAFQIASGRQDALIVGDLSMRVDWSYAHDSVRAFQMILALSESQDFIISSGEAHSVLEFIEIVFQYFNIEVDRHVIEDRSVLKRIVPVRIGDNSRLQRVTGWRPSMSFTEMVNQLIVDSLTLYTQSSKTDS